MQGSESIFLDLLAWSNELCKKLVEVSPVSWIQSKLSVFAIGRGVLIKVREMSLV